MTMLGVVGVFLFACAVGTVAQNCSVTLSEDGVATGCPPSATLLAPPSFGPLNPPDRLLLGPGPSNAHPRVHAAMAKEQIGHLDPAFLEIMEEVKDLLRYTWQTENPFTIPVSGTGSAAMEASLANTVERGDVVLVGVNGYFGGRLCDMASRYGADVRRVDTAWGTAFTLEELTAAVETHKPAILALVHAETSTGVLQDLSGVGDLCRKHDCLLLIDTVTSIAGLPVLIDEWKVDMAYAGGQKALSVPPGISPLTFGERALAKIDARSNPAKVPNWYLDMQAIRKYLVTDGARSYHHTAPISMVYALREGLAVLAEETLPVSWARHQDNAELLWSGLNDIGLECLVDRRLRLPTLSTVKIPDGVNGGKVVKHLLEHHNIEIGGGLGDLKGIVWRIGLMGHNSRPENVAIVLAALKEALALQGYKPAM